MPGESIEESLESEDVTMRERRLTVSTLSYFRRPSYPDGPPGGRVVPYLRVRGLWLERLGFLPGSRVRVEARHGRLVLTVDRPAKGA